jgi:hypothetical protein
MEGIHLARQFSETPEPNARYNNTFYTGKQQALF